MDEKRRLEIRRLIARVEHDTIDSEWGYPIDVLCEAAVELLQEIDRLTPDAKLGAAVRGMGDYARRDGRFDGHDPTLAVTLGLDDSSIEEWRVDDHALLFGVGDTPEAALKAAGLMED